MRPLRFELASKRAERTSERGLILGVEPHKRMGSKPTGFAAPVLSLLCTRRLHNCRGRTGETTFEGYRLFESAFHGNLQG